MWLWGTPPSVWKGVRAWPRQWWPCWEQRSTDSASVKAAWHAVLSLLVSQSTRPAPHTPAFYQVLCVQSCNCTAGRDIPNICCHVKYASFLTPTRFSPGRSSFCFASPCNLAVHVWQMLAEQAMTLEWTDSCLQWVKMSSVSQEQLCFPWLPYLQHPLEQLNPKWHFPYSLGNP